MRALHPEVSLGRERTDLWSFPAISVTEILSRSNAVESLYNNSVNGYLIKGYMSPEEVEYALERRSMLDSNANGLFSKGAGFSNPRSFSMLASDAGIDDASLGGYLNDIDVYTKNLEAMFPFGYNKRLFDFFSKLEGGIPVLTPHVVYNNTPTHFTSSTIRVCYPECGGMNTHVGNMFRGVYPAFYSYLDKLMDVSGQISYFVMLSKPESGGDLVLFDALWPEYVSPTDDGEIVTKTGEKILQSEMDYQLVSPEPGDMILFNGGNIWHKVDTLTGNRDRITIGGFLAKTRDGKNIYCWA